METGARRRGGLAGGRGTHGAGRLIAWPLLLAVLGLGIWGFGWIFHDARPATLRVAITGMAAGAVLSIPALLILRWLGRRDPLPWTAFALSFGWGLAIATGLAAPLNDHAGILGLGFVEEAANAAGLAMLVLFLRGAIRSPLEGAVLGAVIGLGFNAFELGEYLANGFAEKGVAPWTEQLLSRFALLGLSGHALYTAVTGMMLGFALARPRHRWRLAVGGVLLASVFHLLWDTLGVIVGAVTHGLIAGDGAAVHLLWLATVVHILIVNGLAMVIVWVGLRRAARALALHDGPTSTGASTQ